MDSQEYLCFLKSVLVKIENTINLIEQIPSKHIPAYHKMLGVQQKFAGLDKDDRSKFFPQMVKVRGIINYLTNGNYERASEQIFKLKGNIIKICLDINNEKDTNTK